MAVNQIRRQQLNAHIKRLVSEALREINHEEFHHAVVTDLMLSNDNKSARVWVAGSDRLIARINAVARREIQRYVTKRLARRTVPRLEFIPETDTLNRVDVLLDQLEKEPKSHDTSPKI